MDRIHFIARQVERLDDQAFATLLAWFDRYADLRWAGRIAPDHAGSGAVAIACMAPSHPGGPAAGCDRIGHLRIGNLRIGQQTPRMACEPQVAAWLAHAMHRE